MEEYTMEDLEGDIFRYKFYYNGDENIAKRFIIMCICREKKYGYFRGKKLSKEVKALIAVENL